MLETAVRPRFHVAFLGWDAALARMKIALRPAAVAAMSAIVATWPLAIEPNRFLLGTEPTDTIPLFSAWNLWWTADRIPHGMRHFFDAPFFYPTHGVTAYSEPMPLLGALSAPFWWLGVPLPVTYTLVCLLVLTLNGVFAFRLARRIGVSERTSLAVIPVAITLPFTGRYAGVLPCLAVFGVFWTIEGLVSFARTGTRRAAGWSWAGYVATFLAFEQYALFMAPFFVGGIFVALCWAKDRRQSTMALALPSLAGVICVLIVAIPTSRILHGAGFNRPDWIVRSLSATPSSFLTRSETSTIGFPSRGASDTAGLFPGFGLSLLCLGGLVIGLAAGGRRRSSALVMAVATIGATLLALGLNLHVGSWTPYESLQRLMSPVRDVRSPHRAAALMQVFMLSLGFIFLAWVESRRKLARIAIVLVLLSAAENLVVPARLSAPFSASPAWAEWLRAQPSSTVIAHIPFPNGGTEVAYQAEAARLAFQTVHHKPMINGYSGFFPTSTLPNGSTFPSYTYFQFDMARNFPNVHLFCSLIGLGSNTIVFDQPWLRLHARALRPFRGDLRIVYRDSKVTVARLADDLHFCA